MPRLVDLGDVLAVINASMLNLEYTDENRAMQKAISMLPTVDAVPVVRCKDCMHGEVQVDGVFRYELLGKRREDAVNKEFTLYADDKPIVTFKASKIVLHGEWR